MVMYISCQFRGVAPTPFIAKWCDSSRAALAAARLSPIFRQMVGFPCRGYAPPCLIGCISINGVGATPLILLVYIP